MNSDEQEQASMYQERRGIRQSLRPLSFQRHHWTYIRTYARNNRRTMLIVVCLIIGQAVLELAAVLTTMNLGARGLIGYAVAGAIAYLAIAFMATKKEREFVLGFINDVRRRLFSTTLERAEKTLTNEGKADLLAKISYHLPTLSLGLDRSLFGCLRWALSVCLITALAIATGPGIGILALSAILMSIVLMVIAYMIAMHYVSREVTAYSQIMRHLSLSLAEFPTVKSQHLEAQMLKKLDRLVATDTHLRVRRDLWLRYLNRILFALLFVGGICVSLFAIPYPKTLVSAIFSLYAVRLFYQALQTGLYLPPLKLGIVLSIQPGNPSAFRPKAKSDWESITFRSNKTKLFPEGPYFKNTSISLRKGERHMFVGEASSGKTCLAHLFGDRPLFNPAGWIVIEDDRRSSAEIWAESTSDRYLFGPQFRTERTVGEITLGKDKQDIGPDDIERLYALCERYPALGRGLSKKRFAGESAVAFEHNPSALFSIQALHCILNEIKLISIDNAWIDLGYTEIDEAIRSLSEALPNSVIVMFARTERHIITKQIQHEIKKGLVA